MFRTLLSYFVLVLVPAVSLGIAVGPYVWVKKKVALRPASTRRGEQAQDDNVIKWKHLWLAFAVGLVGNVVWWWILFELPVIISDYIYQVELSGLTFAFLFYAIFLAITPFIFFKFRYHKLQAKQIVYCLMLSLIIASLEIGAGIVLFFIGWNRLFYAFN